MSSKSLKLRFKGDETQRKKKKKSSSGGGAKRSRKDEQGQGEEGAPDGNEQAWVPVERITDLAGPSFLYQVVEGEGNNSRCYCLGLNPALHRVEAHVLQAPALDEQAAAALDLEGAEVLVDSSAPSAPTDITQVWVTTRVLDTPSNAPRYTLRSSESRFITSERNGGVSAEAEARGPLEEWLLVEVQGQKGRFCLQSANRTVLGLDEVAGGRMVVRCDAEAQEGQEAPSPSEQWQIQVQWKYRAQARKKEEGEIPLRERDAATFKRVKT